MLDLITLLLYFLFCTLLYNRLHARQRQAFTTMSCIAAEGTGAEFPVYIRNATYRRPRKTALLLSKEYPVEASTLAKRQFSGGAFSPVTANIFTSTPQQYSRNPRNPFAVTSLIKGPSGGREAELKRRRRRTAIGRGVGRILFTSHYSPSPLRQSFKLPSRSPTSCNISGDLLNSSPPHQHLLLLSHPHQFRLQWNDDAVLCLLATVSPTLSSHRITCNLKPASPAAMSRPSHTIPSRRKSPSLTTFHKTIQRTTITPSAVILLTLLILGQLAAAASLSIRPLHLTSQQAILRFFPPQVLMLKVGELLTWEARII